MKEYVKRRPPQFAIRPGDEGDNQVGGFWGSLTPIKVMYYSAVMGKCGKQ